VASFVLSRSGIVVPEPDRREVGSLQKAKRLRGGAPGMAMAVLFRPDSWRNL
jgi:hypothetical protein